MRGSGWVSRPVPRPPQYVASATAPAARCARCGEPEFHLTPDECIAMLKAAIAKYRRRAA